MSDGVTRENEQFLDAQVAAGAYPGRAEALNAAIDLLRLRTELVARIDEGCRQLDAGDYDELAVEDLTAYFAGLLPQSTDSFLNSQP